MVGSTNEVFRDESLDIETPIDAPLSARYKRSFAYATIKDRLPVILTKVVDRLCRDKIAICQEYGEESKEQLKDVIGACSRLRNEMQTNKRLTILTSGPDRDNWNRWLQEEHKWFHSPWLFVECYLYRRLKDMFEASTSFKTFDPFGLQKREAFTSSLPAIKGLGSHLLDSVSSGEKPELKFELFKFMKVCLWGNKCDLSISAGEKNDQYNDPIDQLESLESYILVNDLERLWDYLSEESSRDRTIDIVLDNSGFELFTDLCLADILVTRGLAANVRIHVKAIPWFISDVTTPDFYWTLQQLDICMPELGARWRQHLQDGRWQLQPVSYFWTSPCDFSAMQDEDPELYSLLSNSSLVIYKGDLNYRKLVGDINWKPHTMFCTAIRNTPRPLLTLRTLKADVVVGLPEDKAEKLNVSSPDWMVSGDFAVIQLCL